MIFGNPTPGNHDQPTSAEDGFGGYGLPDTDDGGHSLGNPIGVFDAVCTGAKAIRGQWLALEFRLTDPEFTGEEYSIMAAKIDPSDSRAEAKKKSRGWLRLGDALRAMGLAVNPQTQVPLDGWTACAGLTCRLALSTYDKQGADQPTIVWGKPKARSRNGVEVGFPADLADDSGKFRDYGCGVLPPA